MDGGATKPFDPAGDSDGFRAALGSFATGVTVITTEGPDGHVAIIANSFSSVSLDPPLVLWSPAKSSKRFEHFAQAPRFVVHILAADQRDICMAIVKSKTAIADVPAHMSSCGLPIIEGALATFECTLSASHDAGDHIIVVGEVTKAHHNGGDPLIFHGGNFGAFSGAKLA